MASPIRPSETKLCKGTMWQACTICLQALFAQFAQARPDCAKIQCGKHAQFVKPDKTMQRHSVVWPACTTCPSQTILCKGTMHPTQTRLCNGTKWSACTICSIQTRFGKVQSGQGMHNWPTEYVDHLQFESSVL